MHNEQSTASTAGHKPYLPIEIILYIIDCLVPSTQPTPIAVPPSHPVTKTLLSLARTSRATYPTAIRHLYRHCLYIDNAKRLHKLIRTLLSNSDIDNGIDITPPSSLGIPQVSLLLCVSSLFLQLPSTFGSGKLFSLPKALCTLWSLTAPTLRRLVVDLPLRENQLKNPRLSNRIREAFDGLRQLEVFCSVGDDLYLPHFSWPDWSSCDPAWSAWPNLRTLALYGPDLDEPKFWQGLTALNRLKTLILTRLDGQWHGSAKEISRRVIRELGAERELNVYLVNVESDHGVVEDPEESEEKDGKGLRVKIMNVPTSYYGDEDVIDLCEDWVRRRILRGEEMLEE